MKTLFKYKDKKFSRSLLTGLTVLLVVAMGATPALARGHGGHGVHGGHGGHRGHGGYHERGMGFASVDHDHDPSSDIYTSPGLKITTASQVNSLPDGEGALLKGHIVGQINGDEFLFHDNTGLAPVLISQSDWRNMQAGPSDLVEIHGRIVHTGAGAAVQGERIATIPG